MRIAMVCSVSLFVALSGCAFEDSENLDLAEEELVATEEAEATAAVLEQAPADQEVVAEDETGEAEAAPDEELAEKDQAVDSSLAPCGLSITASGDGKVWYQIRNCHSYRVHRELDIAGWWDICPCHNLAPGETESGACARPASSVRGIRSC